MAKQDQSKVLGMIGIGAFSGLVSFIVLYRVLIGESFFSTRMQAQLGESSFVFLIGPVVLGALAGILGVFAPDKRKGFYVAAIVGASMGLCFLSVALPR